MAYKKMTGQIIWGIALMLMGVVLFYRMPDVMLRIEKIDSFSSILLFIRFCFYILGIMLMGGGLKKCFGSFITGGK